MMQGRPGFVHAETMPHYMPKRPDPRREEAMRIAASIRQLKTEDPQVGRGIYDSLVDELIENTLRSTQGASEMEPSVWSAPQRCVWRDSKLDPKRRWDVVEDRSILPEPKAYAVVSGGRWIVPCVLVKPNRQSCSGAQYASWLDRRFHCVDCESQMVSGRWIEVVWPNNIADIERVLNERPDGSERHWFPHESVEDLMQQNAEVGN